MTRKLMMAAGSIRTVLAAVGGAVVGAGFASEGDLAELTKAAEVAFGAVLTLAALAWSLWEKITTKGEQD